MTKSEQKVKDAIAALQTIISQEYGLNADVSINIHQYYKNNQITSERADEIIREFTNVPQKIFLVRSGVYCTSWSERTENSYKSLSIYHR